MNIFDQLLMRPIFNLLALLYNFIGDFGVAIIILAILVRVVMWPLVKKQLRQTKLMRAIQPELKRIKKQTKGNRMLESQMMMELYRERNIKPFSQILTALIQFPILIAVFSVVRLFDMNLPTIPASLTKNDDTTCQKSLEEYEDKAEKAFCRAVKTRKDREAKLKVFVYPGVSNLSKVKTMVDDPENFKPKLFGSVDLTKSGFNYTPAVIMAALAALFQYVQMKQTMPDQKKKRRLRDIMREAANGKEPDQSEMMASMSTMMKFFPIMIFFFAVNFPAALALYWAAGSVIAVAQQKLILGKDLDDIEKIANEPLPKSNREKRAVEAEIVTRKPIKNKKSHITEKPKPSGGTTVVRRIKAK